VTALAPQIGRVALVFRGDQRLLDAATLDGTRLAPIVSALEAVGIEPRPCAFSEARLDDARHDLDGIDGVLVWVDPVAGSADRSVLDALLRDVAQRGAWVSAHPDVILRMGTKQVLYDTRELGWGMETDWVPAMQTLVDVDDDQLPVLWDADFLFGDRDADGTDRYVLCEINVSAVTPFPPEAPNKVAQAALAMIRPRR
jgi:hypothetical protein